jgi:hypothetical protein
MQPTMVVMVHRSLALALVATRWEMRSDVRS